jgi:predicted nucleic acid-binding protein
LKLFIDTWGWLVLEDSRDPLHRAAAAIYAEAAGVSGNVFTTNFVLDEAITLLIRRRPFEEVARFTRGLLTSPFIEIEEITPARFRRAFDMRLAFRDKPDISFTDLTTMIVAQDLKLTDILSGDRHFLQVGLGFRLLP